MRRKSPMAARKIKRSDDTRVAAKPLNPRRKSGSSIPDKGASQSAHDAAAVRFTGRVLDARPDRLDFRDLPYRPPLRSLPPFYPSEQDVRRFIEGYVAGDLILDQGNEGACTGFGLACVANYLLWIRHV